MKATRILVLLAVCLVSTPLVTATLSEAGQYDGFWYTPLSQNLLVNGLLLPEDVFMIKENAGNVVIVRLDVRNWGSTYFGYETFMGTLTDNSIHISSFAATVFVDMTIILHDEFTATLHVNSCTDNLMVCLFPTGATVPLQKLF